MHLPLLSRGERPQAPSSSHRGIEGQQRAYEGKVGRTAQSRMLQEIIRNTGEQRASPNLVSGARHMK